MFKSLKARFAVIGALVLLCAWLMVDRGITLGLDLQGGTHLALEVQDPAGALNAAQRADAVDRALRVIRTRVDELGVSEPTIQKVGQERLVVELPGASAEEQQRAKDIIQRSAFLQFQIVRPLTEIESVLPRIDRAVAAAQGGAGAAAQQPGAPAAGGIGGLFESAGGDAAADSATAGAPFSSRVLASGLPGQFVVAEEDVEAVNAYLALPQVQQIIPRGLELAWGVTPEGAQAAQMAGYRPLYLLESRPMMTGEYLQDAQAQRDPQLGQPEVVFELNRRGGRIFERATGDNVGEAMAIVLDERVYSAPTIQSAISMSGRITLGGGSIEEARDLALVLRAGALPAPLEIVEERAIGPSLGEDSVEAGRIAGLVGVTAVILMVLGYYRFSGVLAVVGLAVYVLLLLGAMAGLGAVLTFPGIAGLVLSIGMALDANVLIFERIREELDAGRPVRTAIDAGFAHAMSAIIDGNVTTLISSAILFYVGTGPVRGFAVTLGIGIIASLFSAVFVVRTLFMLYLGRRGSQTRPLSI